MLHTIRQYPGQIKDCAPYTNPNFENDHRELLIDEPYRAGDDGSGTDHQNRQVAREAAAAAYACLGFVFHSLQGERGDVLFGNTLDCAIGAIDGMRHH